MRRLYLFLFAITISSAQTISFDEALKEAVSNSKSLKKQELNISLAKENINLVNSYNYGVLSLNSQISKTNHSGYVFNSKLSSREATFKDFGFSQMADGINTAPKDLNYPESRKNINSYISYDIPIFMGFRLYNQKEILKLQEKANEILYTLDRKNLEYEILKAYNSAVVAKDFVKALENASKTMNFIHKGAIEFHKNGLVTKLDVNEAKLYELSVNSSLVEAKGNFDLAIAYLRFLTSNHNISNVESFENIYFDLEDFEKLYSKVLDNKDEIKLQHIEILANKKNIDIQKGSYLPTVFSHLEYGFNDNTFTTSKDKDYYIALVGISINLFDASRSANLQKSKIEYLKSNLSLEKLKDALKLELQKAILEYKTKQAVLKEKELAKNLAFDIFNQAQLQYKNRLISMTTLLLQESNYRKQEALFVNARYENALALAKLNLVLGENLKKDNR